MFMYISIIHVNCSWFLLVRVQNYYWTATSWGRTTALGLDLLPKIRFLKKNPHKTPARNRHLTRTSSVFLINCIKLGSLNSLFRCSPVHHSYSCYWKGLWIKHWCTAEFVFRSEKQYEKGAAESVKAFHLMSFSKPGPYVILKFQAPVL